MTFFLSNKSGATALHLSQITQSSSRVGMTVLPCLSNFPDLNLVGSSWRHR